MNQLLLGGAAAAAAAPAASLLAPSAVLLSRAGPAAGLLAGGRGSGAWLLRKDGSDLAPPAAGACLLAGGKTCKPLKARRTQEHETQPSNRPSFAIVTCLLVVAYSDQVAVAPVPSSLPTGG